tara:strand:- start:5782 stop:6105 length:324 start_codon:yes stop_codon:yes gene_type:complete
MFQKKKNNDDNVIFAVLIINSHYVRWEMFTKKDKIDDLHNLLKNKYNIELYTAEINNVFMYVKKAFKCKDMYKKNNPLIDFCNEDNLSLTIRISTKDVNFKLDKNIY